MANSGQPDFFSGSEGVMHSQSYLNSLYSGLSSDPLLEKLLESSTMMGMQFDSQQCCQPAGTSSGVVHDQHLTNISVSRTDTPEMAPEKIVNLKKRQADKAYRERQKQGKEQMKSDLGRLFDENQSLQRDNASLIKTLQSQEKIIDQLKRDLTEVKSEVKSNNKMQSATEQHLAELFVGLPTATDPVSSVGPPQFGTMPPQLGASSSTVTEFALPASITPDMTSVFGGNVSNNRLIFFNSSTHPPLKLTPSNFSAWRQQLRALLIGYGLIGFVNGSIPSPPATPAVPADPNSYFNLWQRQDQLILYLILTSLTESMLPHLSSAQTSRDAWVTLHSLFADDRLLAHEESLQRHNNVEQPVVVPANVAQRNTGQQADSRACFGSGASNSRRQRQSTPPHGRQEVGYNTQHVPDGKRRRCHNFEQDPVQVCQICDSNGHVAKSCPKLATHPQIKCVTSQTNDWLFDIGANTDASKSQVLLSE